MKNLPAQGSWVRQAGVGFYNFWFRKNDPTTLGFIRIVTGLVVLYVHFAYIFDLQAFFGPRGWNPQELANQTRREIPTQVYKWGWHTTYPSVRLPDQLYRKTELLDFFARLPESKVGREQNLRYVFALTPQGESGPEQQSYRACLDFAAVFSLGKPPATAAEFEDQKKQVLDRIRSAGNIKVGLPVPAYIAALPEAEKERAAEAIVPFWHQLRAIDSEANALVALEWLRELTPRERRRFREEFLANLPDDPAGRAEFLRYMGDWNVDPNQIYARGNRTFSVWLHITDPTAMAAVHGLVMVTIVMFILGLYTRTTATLVWVFSVMYIHRNNYILFGMDTMMNILLLYLMVGPSGAALSIDRLRARHRASKALLAADGRSVPWAERTLAGPTASIGANFAVRLWQVHFCFIYMSAALSKLKGTLWWDQTAAWYTISNPEFSPIWMSFYETALRALVEHRFLMSAFLASSVAFTMLVELGFPFLIWTRLRPYMIALSATFHASIGIFMGLTCFSLFMMCLGLSYFPAQAIRRTLGIQRGAGTKYRLDYDPASKRQTAQVAFLRAADIGSQLDLIPGTRAALRLSGPGVEADGDRAVSAGLSRLTLTSGWLAKVLLLPVFGVWSMLLPAEGAAVSAKPKSRSVA